MLTSRSNTTKLLDLHKMISKRITADVYIHKTHTKINHEYTDQQLPLTFIESNTNHIKHKCSLLNFNSRLITHLATKLKTINARWIDTWTQSKGGLVELRRPQPALAKLTPPASFTDVL